uniref:Uncharacterized protein n=1 Tax=Piliocolobus tephrosceles TaxID=591936 RepID=A0A8C9LUZ9_9PRIM
AGEAGCAPDLPAGGRASESRASHPSRLLLLPSASRPRLPARPPSSLARTAQVRRSSASAAVQDRCARARPPPLPLPRACLARALPPASLRPPSPAAGQRPPARTLHIQGGHNTGLVAAEIPAQEKGPPLLPVSLPMSHFYGEKSLRILFGKPEVWHQAKV